MNHHHRIRITCLSVLCLFITQFCVLLAQPDEHKTTPADNSLQSGSWAFQFQIANNFTLRSFQGAIFSAKRHYSEHAAVRLGTSISLNATDEDRDGTSLQADTLVNRQLQNGSTNSQSVEVTAQYLYYPNPQDPVNVFFGAGPLIQFSRSHSDANSVFSNPGAYARTDDASSDSKSWGWGATGVAGVEWFAARSFSLHAEYGLSIVYVTADGSSVAHESYQYPPSPPQTAESHLDASRNGWQFNGTTVKFGLSVYF